MINGGTATKFYTVTLDTTEGPAVARIQLVRRRTGLEVGWIEVLQVPNGSAWNERSTATAITLAVEDGRIKL